MDPQKPSMPGGVPPTGGTGEPVAPGGMGGDMSQPSTPPTPQPEVPPAQTPPTGGVPGAGNPPTPGAGNPTPGAGTIA